MALLSLAVGGVNLFLRWPMALSLTAIFAAIFAAVGVSAAVGRMFGFYLTAPLGIS